MQQKKYSSHFKQEAIHYAVNHPDKSRKQVSEDLGIPYGTFKQWLSGLDLSSMRPQGSAPKTSKQLEQEIRHLKRELEMSRKENELLKKFSVYMAKLQK
jgi:transposase-like protein